MDQANLTPSPLPILQGRPVADLLAQLDGDGFIEYLAGQEYRLARHVAAYRQMLSVALEQLHEVTHERDRLRSDNRRLRDVYGGRPRQAHRPAA